MRDLGARSGRPRHNYSALIAPPPPRKEQAECCLERALPDGRLPIGWCSPECIRRPEVWEQVR